LCGAEQATGKSFEHRKEWVESRLARLAKSMAVDICGFAVMSNHIHLVVRIRPDVAASWSAEEVVRRWWKLFGGRRDGQEQAASPSAAERAALLADPERVETLRQRLADLSWFMRSLCEPIARRANREDGCTGRFWEGRFKSQALLDEAAILACSIYVDLNPIRAGIAKTPETSRHTSAARRIEARKRRARRRKLAAAGTTDVPVSKLSPSPSAAWLCRLSLQPGQELPSSKKKGFLEMSLTQYLKLLDWTGRQIRRGKRGSIPAHLAPIFERLRIDDAKWVTTVKTLGRTFHRAVGRAESLMAKAATSGLRWIAGMSGSRAAFG